MTTRPDHPVSASGIIHNCNLLRGLSPEWQERLAASALVKQIKKGQRIFSQGGECPGLYCMGRGLVRVYKLAPSGKEHVLHLAGPGDTFAEVAVLGDFPLPAHADTVEDTTVALLPADTLRRLLRDHHDLCLQLIGGMARWVRSLVGLLEDVVLRDATARVANHLLQTAPADDDAWFTLPVLKRDLASHLNLTSETLSRTLRRLNEGGLIELRSENRMRIRDRQALDDVAAGLPVAEEGW